MMVFEGQTTRKEVKRTEKKAERGVCRIQKRVGTIGNQGYETVGCGSIIKHQINRQWRSKYFIVTTKEVFRGNFDVKNYRVDFVKSKSKLKTIDLHDAVVGGDIFQNSSGLAVIPLDSHSSLFRHGLFRKKCGILKHRPFEVESFNNEDTSDGAFSDGLCCHMVADDACSTSFGVKPHAITRDLSGQFNVVSNQLGHVSSLGGPILRRVDKKWSAVGISSSATDTSVVPIWLSRENISSESFFDPESNGNTVQQQYANGARTRKGSAGKTKNEGAPNCNITMEKCLGPVMIGNRNSLVTNRSRPKSGSNGNTDQQQYADKARPRKGSAGKTKTENKGASNHNIEMDRCFGPVVIGDDNSLTSGSTPNYERNAFADQQQNANEARTRNGSANNTETENEDPLTYNVTLKEHSGPVVLGHCNSVTEYDEN